MGENRFQETGPFQTLLPSHSSSNGSLTVIESGTEVPFEIRRVYYLHDLELGAERGSHAHKTITQMMVAIAGSFTVDLERAGRSYTFEMTFPAQGLIVPPMSWRKLRNFSVGAVCLVLASDIYDESEYIRDYQEFLQFVESP